MIKKKKNIAILVPKLSSGGAERVVSNISLNLSDNYNQLIILYYNDRIDYDYKGKIINLGLKSSNNPISKIDNFLKRLMEIKKLKKDYNIQSTLSLLSNPNLINILSRHKDKIIISIHYFKPNEVKNIYDKLHDYLISLLYERADYIITVSELIRQYLIRNYKLNTDKVKTIYNGHNIKLISKLSEEEIEDKHKKIFNYPVIINVGSLLFPKGQWHLIKAFKLIKKEIINAKLVFMGQEDLKNDFIALAKSMNLDKDIHFIGFQKNPFKFIKRSSVFAFSSLHEAFPNVLVEALACSTAIVSTDCKSGPRELFSPKSDIFKETEDIEYAEYGVLTPSFEISYLFNRNTICKQEKLFAEAIINLFQNNTLRKKYEIKAFDRAKDFDAEKMIKEYENLF